MIKGWNEMPVRVLEQINDINSTHWTDDEKTFRTTALLAGIEYEDFLNLPLDQAGNLVAQTSWLREPPKKVKVQKKYQIGSRTYRLNAKMDELTTAQYMDYQALKGGEAQEWIGGLLAIALIPEGESYNESDHNEIVEEISNNLNVEEALAIADFFTKRFTKSMRRLVARTLTMIKAAQIVAPQEYKEPLKAARLEMELLKESICESGYPLWKM